MILPVVTGFEYFTIHLVRFLFPVSPSLLSFFLSPSTFFLSRSSFFFFCFAMKAHVKNVAWKMKIEAIERNKNCSHHRISRWQKCQVKKKNREKEERKNKITSERGQIEFSTVQPVERWNPKWIIMRIAPDRETRTIIGNFVNFRVKIYCRIIRVYLAQLVKRDFKIGQQLKFTCYEVWNELFETFRV